jgi:uncharacterized phage protein gp47/JayE
MAARYKTFPEILASMVARLRRRQGVAVDSNIGSGWLTVLECAALQDADQYVQLALLNALFSLDNCKGDDLDRRMVEFGANLFPDLRRYPANTSITSVTAGDGTLVVSASLAAVAVYGATTFSVVDGSLFPVAGAATLDLGSGLAETVIYSRLANVFTVPAGLTATHQPGAVVSSASISTTLAASYLAGVTTVALAAGTGAAWTASGSVIFDRPNVNREKCTFTRVGDVLTLGVATTFAHAAGSSAIQSTFGSDRAVSSGAACFVPASQVSKQINFTTTAGGTLLDGDFTSNLIPVVSTDVGAAANVGSGTISKWTSAPFANATVTNPFAATRGSDREKDDPYRRRVKDFILSLTRGTPRSLVTLTNNLVDPTTGVQVIFSQIVEPVAPGASILYISDGTPTFGLTSVPLVGRDTIISDALAGDRRGTLHNTGPFGYSPSGPATPRLFMSVQRGSATSVGVNYLEDSTQAMTVNAYAGMYLKTADNVFRQIASNTAIRFITSAGDTPALGSYSVYNFGVAPLVPGTDYAFNEATGDVELSVANALQLHDGLVAAADGGSSAYTYTTGVGAYVQRKVNGDPTDFINFPGIRAAGTKVVVAAPSVISPAFVCKLTTTDGFTNAQVSPSVSVAIQTYVNSLGMGGTIVLSEAISLVMALPGVYDFTFLQPTANVPVQRSQLPRIVDANVTVL